MNKSLLLAEATQAVLPTPTLLLSVHVESWALLAVEFQNLDPSQILSVEVRRRVSRTGGFSISTFSDFASIGPGLSIAGDLDVRGSVDVQFWGTASGAGLSVKHAGLLVGDL